MMNKQPSSSLQLSRYVLLFPLLCVLLLSFSLSNAQNKQASLTVKEQEGGSRKINISVSSGASNESLPDSVIYYVDGQEVDKDAVGQIDPETIDNIQVLKGKQAEALLGAKAASGAIVITTRANTEAAEVRALNKRIDAATGDSRPSSDPNPDVTGTANKGKEPLFILDGEEASEQQIHQLSPDRIESMEVLKGDAAVAQYGNKGRDGVVLIRTKDNVAGSTDQLVYVIDPKTFNDSNITQMRKELATKGYQLNVINEYEGGELSTFTVSINSAGGNASASYTAERPEEKDIVIVVTIDPETGRISVVSQKRK